MRKCQEVNGPKIGLDEENAPSIFTETSQEEIVRINQAPQGDLEQLEPSELEKDVTKMRSVSTQEQPAKPTTVGYRTENATGYANGSQAKGVGRALNYEERNPKNPYDLSGRMLTTMDQKYTNINMMLSQRMGPTTWEQVSGAPAFREVALDENKIIDPELQRFVKYLHKLQMLNSTDGKPVMPFEGTLTTEAETTAEFMKRMIYLAGSRGRADAAGL